MSPNEAFPLGLDFVNDISPDETVQSAVWTITVVRGEDSNPSSHLFGPAQVLTPEGSIMQTVTAIGVTGLLPGVLYKLLALVTTNKGSTVELYSHVYGENQL